MWNFSQTSVSFGSRFYLWDGSIRLVTDARYVLTLMARDFTVAAKVRLFSVAAKARAFTRRMT